MDGKTATRCPVVMGLRTNVFVVGKRPLPHGPLTDSVNRKELDRKQELVEKLAETSWLDGAKSYGALLDAGKGNILDLVSMTKTELLEINGIGEKTADTFEATLADRGLSFGMAIDKEVRERARVLISERRESYEAGLAKLR